jgi:hypothetical protein
VARAVVECRDHVDMPQWLAISVLAQLTAASGTRRTRQSRHSYMHG